MKNKYYNNAFIGNERITASFSDKGYIIQAQIIGNTQIYFMLE